MTDHDDDLDLKTLWQSTPPVNLDELLDHVDSERRRMRNLIWFETAGTVFALGLLLFYFKLGVLTNLTFVLVLTVIAVGYQVWMWTWRIGQWRAVSQAPLDLLDLQMKRARTNLRIGQYYAWGTPIAAALGAICVPLFEHGGRSFDLAPVAHAGILLGLVAMLIGLTWFGVRLMRRSRTQIDALTQRIDALRDQDD